MPDLRIALYQPDIAGNTGTILRFAACLGLSVDIIEPAGFDMSDRSLKRAGMDYLAAVTLTRHVSWQHFEDWRAESGRRLVSYLSYPYSRWDCERLHGRRVAMRARGTAASDSAGRRGGGCGEYVASNTTPACSSASASPSIFASAVLSAL